MGLLPNRVTSQPDKGRLAIRPTGKANNTLPNPASFRCKCACISGMPDDQLAKLAPAIKKNTLAAMRWTLCLGNICNEITDIDQQVLNNSKIQITIRLEQRMSGLDFSHDGIQHLDLTDLKRLGC